MCWQRKLKVASSFKIQNMNFDRRYGCRKPGRGGHEGLSVCQIQSDAHSDTSSNPARRIFIWMNLYGCNCTRYLTAWELWLNSTPIAWQLYQHKSGTTSSTCFILYFTQLYKLILPKFRAEPWRLRTNLNGLVFWYLDELVFWYSDEVVFVGICTFLFIRLKFLVS